MADHRGVTCVEAAERLPEMEAAPDAPESLRVRVAAALFDDVFRQWPPGQARTAIAASMVAAADAAIAVITEDARA